MSKIDYNRKAELLSDTQFMQAVRSILRTESAEYYLHETGVVIPTKMTFDTSQDLRCFFNSTRPEDLAEAEKIIKAEYRRTTRLKSRIELFLDQQESTTFLTLTFSDKTLQNTTPKTRRQFVVRYLKSQSDFYIANLDFGYENGREHYHAVILGKVDLKPWEQYGFIFAEKVGNRSELTRSTIPNRYKELSEKEARLKMRQDTEKKLARYVAKLSNHAIKETTRRSCLIYSKLMPKPRLEPVYLPLELRF